ncbi:MAG: hypothetical protein KME04_05490 [Pleurocapsa minor GSE-CHR-MK-17-07R]|jgi:hypothetical protein|nr:hypothetical protein [Pleurocapsa minor GSE-CHR-MK 17-07R]
MFRSDSPLSHSHAPSLRALAERLGIPTVAKLARQPGVSSVFRVTAHYHDRRARDSVATLVRRNTGAPVLEVVYDRLFEHKPIVHALTGERYQTFYAAAMSIDFDRMTDQPGIPPYDVTDVWLVERAAGTFAREVLVAPTLALEGKHAMLVNAIRHGLPELVREASG